MKNFAQKLELTLDLGVLLGLLKSTRVANFA